MLPRRPDSCSRETCRYNRALLEFRTVPREHFCADRTLLSRSEADETYDPRMLETANDRQFAEVLVDGDKNPLLLVGSKEDFLIPGIAFPFG